MFVLAHNDPVWITFGIAVGIALGLVIVLRAAFQGRK